MYKFINIVSLIVGAILLSFGSVRLLQGETLTIVTYYPSPYGVYDSLVSNKLGVGDVNGDSSLDNGDLPSDAGNLLVAGNIGVGVVSPSVRVDVNGGIKIGSETVCNVSTEGTIRYNASSKSIEYCDGSNWRVMGGMHWGSACRANIHINDNSPLCCAADEYLVDVWVADEGNDGDVVPGSYGGITRGYGGCVNTVGAGGGGIHAFGILCCKDQ